MAQQVAVADRAQPEVLEAVVTERVDRDGNAALIRAAEEAGVDRFVFVSALGMTEAMVALVPFFAAKRATERLLQASRLRPVSVRPAAFQETWLGPKMTEQQPVHAAFVWTRRMRRQRQEWVRL